MTPRLRTTLTITGAALAFGLGYVAHRPQVQTVTVEKRVEVQVESKQRDTRESTGIQQAADRNERVVTRIVYKPGGERIVERWRDTQDRAFATTQTQVATVEKQAKSTSADYQVTTVKVPLPDTKFHLTALTGMTWDWKREYGGALSFKVWGPFTLTAYGSNHAVGGGLGVTF